MAKAFKEIQKFIQFEDRITFGKYSGKTWEELLSIDPNYIVWCIGNTDNWFEYNLVVEAIREDYRLKKLNRAVQREISKRTEELRNDMYPFADAPWDEDVPF